MLLNSDFSVLAAEFEAPHLSNGPCIQARGFQSTSAAISQLILFFFDSLTVCVKAGAHPVLLCLLLIKHSFDCEPK